MHQTFKDRFNNTLVLTDEQWQHIIEQHPEIGSYKDKIIEVLKTPEVVKRSKRDKDTFLYYKYYKNIYEGKYILVVAEVKLKKAILTCYLTDRVKEGDFIWKKI